MKSKILKLITITAIICSVSQSFAQNILIQKKDGTSQRGQFVKADPNGDLWIKDQLAQVKVRAQDYSFARLLEKPKEIAAAEKLLASKDYNKAATEFASCYEKFKFVGYDVFCIWGEASALAALGKKTDAINKLKLLDNYILTDTEKEAEFYEAKKLLATLYIDDNKFDEALKVLTELAQSNDDDIAAFSFISRGNILNKQGKKKDAVLMYMRTALLFPTENKERPKALLLLANTLKEMQDIRSSTFADMLKSEYPGNPLINELKN